MPGYSYCWHVSLLPQDDEEEEEGHVRSKSVPLTLSTLAKWYRNKYTVRRFYLNSSCNNWQLLCLHIADLSFDMFWFINLL